MKPKGKKNPARSRGREKTNCPKINPPPSESNRFDTVERKLSLTLDALLDAIEAYRELKR